MNFKALGFHVEIHQKKAHDNISCNIKLVNHTISIVCRLNAKIKEYSRSKVHSVLEIILRIITDARKVNSYNKERSIQL